MVKTPYFQRMGYRFNLWQGELRSPCGRVWQKKKKKGKEKRANFNTDKHFKKQELKSVIKRVQAEI